MNVVKSLLRKVALAVLPTHVINAIRMAKNSKKANRRLEIGPGCVPLEGYETLDIVPSFRVDYVLDASKPLPFPDGTFVEIYASHVLEHFAWYHTERILREWVRILAPGGWLKIMVPDGLKICHALLQYELQDEDCSSLDGEYPLNPEKNPWLWVNFRIFTYGDMAGDLGHPNWHRTLFTRRYLRQLLEKVGLENIRDMHPAEILGYDHGWINLAMKGQKPCSIGTLPH